MGRARRLQASSNYDEAAREAGGRELASGRRWCFGKSGGEGSQEPSQERTAASQHQASYDRDNGGVLCGLLRQGKQERLRDVLKSAQAAAKVEAKRGGQIVS